MPASSIGRQDGKQRHLDLAEEVGQASVGKLPLESRRYQERSERLSRRSAGHRLLLGAGVRAERAGRQLGAEPRRGDVVDRL